MAESYKHPEYMKYKFRELKVYASTEWLADNKKNSNAIPLKKGVKKSAYLLSIDVRLVNMTLSFISEKVGGTRMMANSGKKELITGKLG